jgi:uncharacterized protein (TIGR02266 family)
MSPEKRIAPRSRKRLSVRFGIDETDKLGFTRNVSSTGLFVQTNLPLPPGTLIRLEIAFPERTFVMMGRVAWAKKVPAQLAHVLECGMGVRFVQPPPEFKAFFEEWQKR